MRTPLLFTEISVFDVLQHQQMTLRNEIERLSADTVAQVPEEELIRELSSKFKMEVPVLVEESAYTSHREVDVDVSHDPMRMIFDRGRPFYIRGTEISISVPFKGDPNFFRIRPSTFNLNPPRAQVHGQEVTLVFTRTDANAAPVKSEYEKTVQDINQYLGWLKNSVEDFNSKIGQQIQSLVLQRKRKVVANAEMVASLGLPVKKDSGRVPSALLRKSESVQRSIKSVKRWDVFISHATEDKNEIARPLAQALEKAGVSVWYDEFSLKVGDSLRGSLDFGLANSRYGIVILSSNFFSKHWPVQELNALMGRETNGRKIILPIWHRVGSDEVRQFSPLLADKIAIQSSEGLDKLVEHISAALEDS